METSKALANMALAIGHDIRRANSSIIGAVKKARIKREYQRVARQIVKESGETTLYRVDVAGSGTLNFSLKKDAIDYKRSVAKSKSHPESHCTRVDFDGEFIAQELEVY